MKGFIVIVMSALTLVLSACGTSAPPTETLSPEEELLGDTNYTEELDALKIELTGCTLPALQVSTVYLSESTEGCLGFLGCIRYEAK
jgi:hypothetical protein